MAAIIACIFMPNDVPQRKRPDRHRAPSRPNPLPRIETPHQAYSPPMTSVPPQRKTSKFWFLKPGALPATVAEGSSPYHTIHVASTSRNTDGGGGGASPKRSDQRSSSAKRRKKKKTSVPPGSLAYSAHQALALAPPPPAPPPPLLLNNKARV